MGLIFFVALNWLLIMVLVGFMKRPASLKDAARDWITHPFKNLFILVFGSSVLVAGWGIVTGELLSWPISTPWGVLKSWQLAGIISFACLIVLFVYSAYESHVYRKHLDKTAKNKPPTIKS